MKSDLELEWKYNKAGVVFSYLVLTAMLSPVVIAVGFLFHVGWSLYDPG